MYVRKADSPHIRRASCQRILKLVANLPIEPLKYLLLRAAHDRAPSVMHVDFTRAYLYADATPNIYVKLPEEDQEEHEWDMCGKLVKAM